MIRLQDEPLCAHTTFRIGGPARYYLIPESEEEVMEALVFAKENGYSYYVVGKGSNMLFSDEGFDGVVIACIDFSDPEVVELVNSKIPVVTIDHMFNNATAIVSDNIQGMKDLVNCVLQRGHTKIAYIHGSDSAVTKNRLTSFYKTTQEAGIDIPDEYIREAAYRSVEEAYERTRELLALKDRPTCILYPDDVAGFGDIKAIKEAGYTIPRDISIAGYDGIRFGQYLTPPLTTLEQDTEKIGKEAANELIQLIENPKTTGIHRVVVEGKVRPGGTVKLLSAE